MQIFHAYILLIISLSLKYYLKIMPDMLPQTSIKSGCFLLYIFFFRLLHSCSHTDTHPTLSHERFSVKHIATTLWNTVIHPIYCRNVFFIPPLIRTSPPDISSLMLEMQLWTSTWESFGFLQDRPDISQALKTLTFASKQSREKKSDF